MTTKQLAQDIALVMELDDKRTQGEWGKYRHTQFAVVANQTRGICSTAGFVDGSIDAEVLHDQNIANADFIVAAPLMADIIRRQQDVIRELHKALEVANNRVGFLAHCTATIRHMDANDGRYTPMFEAALALAEPLLGGE